MMRKHHKLPRIRCAALLTVFLLALPFSLVAQVPAIPGVPDSEGIIGNNAPLISLTFNGLSQFTEAQATQVSGLHIGQIVDKDDFKAAADRLAQSGGFNKVAYKFNSGPKGVTLEFDLTETSRLNLCILDNFVWFSKDEITAALRKTAPLFGDKIPADSPTLDQVESGLRALLQSKSIPGDVQKIGMANTAGGRNSVSFRVIGVSLPVTAVEFPGASPERQGDLQGAAFGLIGQDFSAYDTSTFAAITLAPIYRRDGYFRVHFASPQGRLSKPTNATPYNVVVTIPVDEGAQYTWGGQT